MYGTGRDDGYDGREQDDSAVGKGSDDQREAVDEVLRHYSKWIRYAALENGHVNLDAEDSIKQPLITVLFQFRFDEQEVKSLFHFGKKRYIIVKATTNGKLTRRESKMPISKKEMQR